MESNNLLSFNFGEQNILVEATMYLLFGCLWFCFVENFPFVIHCTYGRCVWLLLFIFLYIHLHFIEQWIIELLSAFVNQIVIDIVYIIRINEIVLEHQPVAENERESKLQTMVHDRLLTQFGRLCIPLRL